MTEWESERAIADTLRDLTAKVRQLQDEIRGDALISRRLGRPHLPTEDERRARSVVPPRSRDTPHSEDDR